MRLLDNVILFLNERGPIIYTSYTYRYIYKIYIYIYTFIIHSAYIYVYIVLAAITDEGNL